QHLLVDRGTGLEHHAERAQRHGAGPLRQLALADEPGSAALHVEAVAGRAVLLERDHRQRRRLLPPLHPTGIHIGVEEALEQLVPEIVRGQTSVESYWNSEPPQGNRHVVRPAAQPRVQRTDLLVHSARCGNEINERLAADDDHFSSVRPASTVRPPSRNWDSAEKASASDRPVRSAISPRWMLTMVPPTISATSAACTSRKTPWRTPSPMRPRIRSAAACALVS